MSQQLSVTDLPDHIGVSVNHYHDHTDPDYNIRNALRHEEHGIEKGVNRIKYATEAVLYDTRSDVTVATGVAICSPKDTPNKQRGYTMAVRRAIKNYYNKVGK